MSKDDAWVDILVASNGKRMANQDAEMSPRGMSNARTLGVSGSAGAGAGRSDLDLASMEVAQALATVRQLSRTTDEKGDTSRGSSQHIRNGIGNGNGNGNGNGHGYSEEDAYAEDDGEGEWASQTASKRRLGYFDLHPERRPSNYEEPGRSSLSAYGDSMYSEGDFEPTASIGSGERQTDGDIEVPAFIDPVSPMRREHDNAKTESMTLPAATGAASSSQSQSKTTSLIEMYLERERQSTSPSGQAIPTTAPLQLAKPSRLPVCSTSLPHEEVAKPKAPSKPVPSLPRESSPELDGEDDDNIESIEPAAPYVLGELGRSSPMRYVHGAPLHNVLEEREEEEVEE